MKRLVRVYRRRAVAVFATLGVLVGAVAGLALGSFDVPGNHPALNGAVVGFLAGLLVGSTEEYLVPDLARRLGFRALNSFRFVVYAVGLSVAVLVGNALPRMLFDRLGPVGAIQDFVAEGHPARDVGVALAASLIMTFLLQLRRLHNREELWHLFTGRYHSPREERRVFLFVDLADSTGTAEALGPTAYSAYLRDVFREMAEPILATRGLVYQHAGDAVILSWPFARGVRDGACVRCFMEIEAALGRTGRDFEAKYGRRPRVRGAVHGGTVVATWVGEAKRELAFHGDTVNTVARLQGLASGLDRALLVSDAVRAHVALPGFRTERLGGFDLRGRRTPVEVFAVTAVDEARVALTPGGSENPDELSSTPSEPSISRSS